MLLTLTVTQTPKLYCKTLIQSLMQLFWPWRQLEVPVNKANSVMKSKKIHHILLQNGEFRKKIFKVCFWMDQSESNQFGYCWNTFWMALVRFFAIMVQFGFKSQFESKFWSFVFNFRRTFRQPISYLSFILMLLSLNQLINTHRKRFWSKFAAQQVLSGVCQLMICLDHIPLR